MDKRKLASNLILFLFFLLVTMSALFSEFFQNPVKTASEVIDQAKLFATADLGLIKRLSLKNKSGEYIFERADFSKESPWHMTSPREMSANSLFIENLFNALLTIKIKKLYPEETLNNSNFSIDKPTATLGLADDAGNVINIQVGLMNTIDNSTYLKISGKNGIYHVEAPSASLENVTIVDLIESQIIPINASNVAVLKVFHNKKAVLEIKKVNNLWQDAEGKTLALEKVEDYFQELSGLKSTYTLDKQTENQKKQIGNFIKMPEYTLSIEDSKAMKTVDYNISSVTKSISDLDLKNEEFFVVTMSNTATAYVVKKEFVELFNRKSETLRIAVIKN